MKKYRGLLPFGIAGAGLLALSCGAMAADIVEPLPPAPTWTGFHIGAGGGYGSVLHDGFLEVEGEIEAKHDYYLIEPTYDYESERFFNLLEFDDLGDEAGLATVEAGFDWQVDENFVLGIFGDFTFVNFEASGSDFVCGNAGDFDCVGKGISVETDNMWTVGGRFGWLSSEQTLWYGLVGYTNARVDVSGDLAVQEEAEGPYPDPIEVFNFLNDDDHVDGITVGAGVESKFTENVSLKLEYRYTSLSSFKKLFDSEDCGSPCDLGVYDEEIDARVDFFKADFDTTVQSIRAVLSWRFNFL